MERRGYYFDPTANDALARVIRQEQPSINTSIYHASPEEITRFQNHTFEPDRLITSNQLRKLKRHTFEERKKLKALLQKS